MLSKMKSSSGPETRSSVSRSGQTTSDNEEEIMENDTNNNNNSSLNNNSTGKRNQDELLDIVEVSRKRRLSKDSADSLSSFIKWSFSHIDPSVPDQILSQHAKLSSGLAGSSAANLVLMKQGQLDKQSSLGTLLSATNSGPMKRPRTQVYSPGPKYSPTSQLARSNAPRKSSSYLGNVVERLHHQQQQQIQQQQQQQQQQQRQLQQESQQQQDLDGQDSRSNAGLSYHLQQFLQQQTSLEDLCSSVGLDDSNQLVLAAAIHRALVDSVDPNGQLVDTKSTSSSTGSTTSPSVTSSSRHQSSAVAAALSMNNRVQQQRHAQAAVALSALANAGSHTHQQLSSATPIVDFECDTCGSSFDDRHRLMQHQSIHLELKKDWFTETPVDEVMKIFNRRRGEFFCNTCNLRFEATFDYDKHNHSVHGQRPYCCQFCGNGTRTFRFWRQYLNHLYDHRYIFSCTIEDCDFTVNRRDSLRFHIFRFHLNCQLPQSQNQQLRSNHNLLLSSNDCDSKWPTIEDNDDDDNEMSVGD